MSSNSSLEVLIGGAALAVVGEVLWSVAPYGGGTPMLIGAFFLALFGGLAALTGVILLIVAATRGNRPLSC